jgi:predicted metal-dependent phosphoesterase TrpH
LIIDGSNVLKVDLHTHSGEDPVDLIPYDARALIDRAAANGYSALAVTLHDRQLETTPLASYARERGIVLIPGIERTVRGKHVLLLNFPAQAAESVMSFDDLRALKVRHRGLVIAPHPFYPHPTALGRIVDDHPLLFDAIELNAFYTRYVDFNRRAIQWAAAHGKPIVANADVHRLNQLGTTFSWIDAEPTPDAVCEAVREHRLTVETTPLTAIQAARHLADLLSADLTNAINRLSRPSLPGDVRARRPSRVL